MKQRIAITGMGLITSCGLGVEPYWEAVSRGLSYLGYFSDPSYQNSPVRIGGQIRDFNPIAFVKSRKSLKLMSREIQLAVAASQLAVQDSGLDLSQVNRDRFGISIGTGIINSELDEVGLGIKNGLTDEGEFCFQKFGQSGIRSLYPLWLLKYLPNMPACHISIAHGLRGPSNTITTSSAAGTQAIGEACRIIERGDADLMLCGGTDSKINAMGLARFNSLGLLSFHNHIPQKAYCPFDRCHDGIILGEGAGLLVLEGWEHARRRSARIYAEIVGYGSSSDFNYDPKHPEDFTGKRQAMMGALQDAAMAPNEIGFLLANGSGIPLEDIQESHAIQSVFQSALSEIKVTGVKPITGHVVYGAGGVELAAGIMALREGRVPPLANLDVPDPECDLPFAKKAESSEAKSFLFNSFGFGGQNAALVVAQTDSRD
ncbi:MAG: beta-ketoacyl-[acyl-carrier-protein] synthase family protein [Candidatus Omnitrophica bacterium]|nr:beta-ketoacyl-[acyl-carrier-protein] synthase family protein [Candidatus Omnitrophota bacterium]